MVTLTYDPPWEGPGALPAAPADALGHQPGAFHRRPLPFVGRQHEFEELLRALDAPVHDGGAFIVSIAGVGGVGKTSLLRQMLERRPAALYAMVDEHDEVSDAATLVQLVVQRLAASLGPRSHAARALAEARRPRDRAGMLTDALVRDVNDAGAAGTQVVLVLDTYEAMRHVAGPWLLETLLSGRGRVVPATREADLRLVVSGREPLQRTDPGWSREWEDSILNLTLEPFSLAETEAFLRAGRGGAPPRPELSPEHVRRAHAATGGLPLWLGLWRRQWTQRGSIPELVSPEEVQSVVDRLLMWWDDPRQLRWVRAAWVPRWFTLELLRVVLEHEAEPAFEWLIRQASIVRGEQGRWTFHDAVRKALRQEGHQRAPAELAGVNDRLADYWQGRLEAPGVPAANAIYHRLLGARPTDGLALLCRLYVRGWSVQDPAVGSLVAAAAEARADAADPAGLEGVLAIEEHVAALQAGDPDRVAAARRHILALNLLPPAERALLLAGGVEPLAPAQGAPPRARRWPRLPRLRWPGSRAPTPDEQRRARALAEYGDALLLAGEFEAALPPLSQSIALEPKNASAHASRGESLRVLGRTREAIADLSAATRLDPGVAWVWSARATAYLALSAPAKAMADAQRALALDGRNAWARAVRGLARSQLTGDASAEALADVRGALELDPGLTWAQAALREWEAAREAQRTPSPED